MDIDLLETLIAVADEGGYASASRLLNISQPAVYQRIQRLEAVTGTPVVWRDGRKIRLTAAGHAIYTRGREVIRQMRLLEDAIREKEGALTGPLSVLVGHGLCEFPAADISLSFSRRHSASVDLRVTARPPRDIDREIRHGWSDVGLHSDPTPVKGLAKDAFYEERYVAVAWPGHRFESLEVLSPTDFIGEDVILMRDVTYTFSQGVTEGWFTQGGVELTPRLISNSFLGIRALVERRAGVAIMPREHAVLSPHVITRPIARPPVRRLFVVTRVTPHEGASLRAFRSYVLSGEWLGEIPPPFDRRIAMDIRMGPVETARVVE